MFFDVLSFYYQYQETYVNSTWYLMSFEISELKVHIVRKNMLWSFSGRERTLCVLFLFELITYYRKTISGDY